MKSIILRSLFVTLLFAVVYGCGGGGGGSGNNEGVLSDGQGGNSKGFSLSPVRGNTTRLGGIAEIDVILTRQPTSDVNILIGSFDETEGVVDTPELIFTTDNWNQPHTIYVRGSNDNVVNEQQNYKIVTGAATSQDQSYSGENPEDIEMKGIVLEIAAPEIKGKLIAGISRDIELEFYYNGYQQLIWSLLQAPTGMTIDENNGLLRWVPPDSAQGTTENVQIRVTDGTRTVEKNIALPLGVSNVLKTEVNNGTLIVADEGSTLKNLSITAIEGNNMRVCRLPLLIMMRPLSCLKGLFR